MTQIVCGPCASDRDVATINDAVNECCVECGAYIAVLVRATPSCNSFQSTSSITRLQRTHARMNHTLSGLKSALFNQGEVLPYMTLHILPWVVADNFFLFGLQVSCICICNSTSLVPHQCIIAHKLMPSLGAWLVVLLRMHASPSTYTCTCAGHPAMRGSSCNAWVILHYATFFTYEHLPLPLAGDVV
jgi:hypothetical protein